MLLIVLLMSSHSSHAAVSIAVIVFASVLAVMLWPSSEHTLIANNEFHFMIAVIACNVLTLLLYCVHYYCIMPYM